MRPRWAGAVCNASECCGGCRRAAGGLLMSMMLWQLSLAASRVGCQLRQLQPRASDGGGRPYCCRRRRGSASRACVEKQPRSQNQSCTQKTSHSDASSPRPPVRTVVAAYGPLHPWASHPWASHPWASIIIPPARPQHVVHGSVQPCRQSIEHREHPPQHMQQLRSGLLCCRSRHRQQQTRMQTPPAIDPATHAWQPCVLVQRCMRSCRACLQQLVCMCRHSAAAVISREF